MKPIRLPASILLQAAAKGRRFKIRGYDGGPLPVDGFDLPVVVDLKGLELSEPMPLLIAHRNTPQTTLGSVDEIHNDGARLDYAGAVTGRSPDAANVIAQHDDGQAWGASIGVWVDGTKLELVPAGHSVQVNRRTVSGPVYVSRRSIQKELSVVASGAATRTNVNLAAAMKGNAMSFEDWMKETYKVDVASLSPELVAKLQEEYDAQQATPGEPATATAAALTNLRATLATDHRRVQRIQAMAAAHPGIAATAIEKGWSPEQTEIAVLKARLQPNAPSNLHHGNGSDSPDDSQILCASFAMTCGGSPKFLARHFGEKVVDAATQQRYRGASLYAVMAHVLHAAGEPIPGHRITDAFITAAFQASRRLEASSGFSTVSLPGILSNSANKLLLEGYESVQTSWRNFCAIGNLADFKPHTRYRLTAGGDFELVPPGGEIKHMRLNNEDTYTVTATTYATMVNLTRENIINDDLGAFEALPRIIGRKAATKLEKLIYTLLLGNAGSFFSVGNGNYESGAGSALDIDALTAAEKRFLNQTDANGDPVLISPEVLLVPTSLIVTANQLTRDTQVVAVGVGNSAAVTPNGNPHAGRFEPIPSPWLENANLSGYSTAGWYLLAKPQGNAGLMEVGFLNAQESPTIENGELDFNRLGVALRGYHDWGLAFQDPKFGVFNVGA